MTAEEMKAAESGAQSAPLPLEGVDISPKHDEGVLKVRGQGLSGIGQARNPRPQPFGLGPLGPAASGIVFPDWAALLRVA